MPLLQNRWATACKPSSVWLPVRMPLLQNDQLSDTSNILVWLPVRMPLLQNHGGKTPSTGVVWLPVRMPLLQNRIWYNPVNGWPPPWRERRSAIFISANSSVAINNQNLLYSQFFWLVFYSWLDIFIRHAIVSISKIKHNSATISFVSHTSFFVVIIRIWKILNWASESIFDELSRFFFVVIPFVRRALWTRAFDLPNYSIYLNVWAGYLFQGFAIFPYRYIWSVWLPVRMPLLQNGHQVDRYAEGVWLPVRMPLLQNGHPYHSGFNAFDYQSECHCSKTLPG